tara:strand:+ start:1196 stop:1936 length:741 start_codon:yes stop_codon:yes gene_type:complete
MEQGKTQEIKMNPEQQIAELQAQIAAAQAQIAQIKSSVAEAKAKTVPEGMHEMPDGSIMADADMESANLQERNTADAVAAYEADKRNLTGNRNADGDFVQAQEKQAIEVTLDKDNAIDKDQNTDEQSAKMKRTSNDPVESVTRSDGSELELDGGRAAAEEVEPSERTMGFKADEGGNMSVDEKDDFWKTQEGYNKAMEMYNSKPAWVKEPTMMFNPETQEYEKIKEEDKEQFEDLSIADNIKQLFG